MSGAATVRAASGIAPEALARLIGAFERAADLDRVWLFGSRARGDHRDASDIDLALEAPRMDREAWSTFEANVEKLGLIYRIDLVKLDWVSDAKFVEHIRSDRKVFWEPRSEEHTSELQSL